MKKKEGIQFKAILLLLVYLISSIPALLFHHHEAPVETYESATSCEKVIYFAHEDGGCHHKSHITQEPEKCWLCDHHTFSPQLFQEVSTEIFAIEFGTECPAFSNRYYFQAPSQFFNRGPPRISSYIA
ncbi:MAG: hypothetical protein WC044_04500 [Crocinitomicaceae bacterium]